MAEKNTGTDIELLGRLVSARNLIKQEIAKVIVGQDAIIENLIITLLCRGHCLLVGVPGLAKTLMISSLSRALDLRFSRIQFTPDLMPSDIVGTEVMEEDPETGAPAVPFRARAGLRQHHPRRRDQPRHRPRRSRRSSRPCRSTRSPSAGRPCALAEPFFVLATQNPIEQEGTYPLPEAQLDRFMFNLWIDYPSREEEIEIVTRTTGVVDLLPEKILNAEDIIALQNLVRKIPVAEDVVSFAVDLARRTRPEDGGSPSFIKDWVRWGAGPRASQYLILAAKARAALDGRYAPSRADVQSVAMPVLRHRLVTTFAAEAEGIHAPISSRNSREKSFDHVVPGIPDPGNREQAGQARSHRENRGRGVYHRASQESLPRILHRVRRTPSVHERAILSATSTGKCMAAPTACTSSVSRKKPT